MVFQKTLLEMTDRELLLEIHQMLCRVCSYIDKVESEEYRFMEDQRAFNVNVAADLYVEMLEKCKNGKIDNKL